MNVQEIQTRIQSTIAEQQTDKESLDGLRADRAKLAVEDSEKNSTKIASLDEQITTLRDKLDNAPAVVSELQSQLAAEQNRLAQAERTKLIERQQEAANEAEILSRNFVSLLSRAAEINTQLRAALSAEADLREITGVDDILQNYCNGSMESLQKLTETMQAQLDTGQHTTPFGPGIVQNATPLRL